MKGFMGPMAILAAFLAAGLALAQPASAQDVYNEKGKVIIEKVTEQDIPRLTKLLDDQDPTVRGKAQGFLVSYGAKSVLDLLAKLGKGANAGVTIETLGAIGDPRAIDGIEKYVTDKDPGVQAVALQALAGMGDEGRAALVRLLLARTNPEGVRNTLAGCGGSEPAARLLRPMMKSGDPATRLDVLTILGAWMDSELLAAIPGLLTDGEAGVRELALDVYGRTAGPYDKKLLAGLLKSDDVPHMREMAAKLMGKTGQADAADSEALSAAATGDKAASVRQEALYALGETKSDGALAVLTAALGDPDKDIRWYALSGLEKLGDKAAVPFILKPFKDKKKMSANEIQTSCTALIAIGEPVDLEPFYPYLLEDEDHHSTGALLRLIKVFGPVGDRKKAIEVLEKYIEGAQGPEAKQRAAGVLDVLKQQQ